MSDSNIESTLNERRVFPPSDDFSSKANIPSMEAYESMYRRSLDDPDAFWSETASELEWFEPWTEVLKWEEPFAQWFVGGKTNVSYNCLDRHLTTWRKNRVALLWEGEPGDVRVWTYQMLHREVCRFANVLASLGLKPGDRATIYLGMVPELPVAMLACARLGVTHNVVFGGFSAEALRDRIHDSQSRVLITADGGYRRGSIVPLKKSADEAADGAPSIEKVIVLRRTGEDVPMKEGRDLWWHELAEKASDEFEAVPLDAEHPLFMLYTSGTTGKPKGVVHTTGGYMVSAYATTKWVFDLKDEDTFWCGADIGWVTGHSYIVYGPLANGATVLMYEGGPDWPEKDRFWNLCEKYGVTVFYTAPTAIRAFMKWGEEWPDKHDLSKLRLLGSVGEPINPEAWMWYHRVLGKERCPIVDTWWQTETGAIMITPLPGVTETRPGSATHPFPGISVALLDDVGNEVEAGLLAITEPWPSMLRTIYGDDERYRETYWSKWDGIYFAGDGAKRDDDGYLWLMGRVDDVLSVAGHRIGTMEVESALVDHPAVVEAAVVGKSHEVKGQSVAAFVTLKGGKAGDDDLVVELKQHVVEKIGAIARPETVIFTADLPKTRSGKIMRRLLKDVAEGKALGDTTTLADPAVVEQLKSQYEGKEG